MTVRELLKQRPGEFIVKAKIWTDKRSTIESLGGYDPDIGLLVTRLLCIRTPTERQRELIKQLMTELRGKEKSS